jgi:tetratricopeptide (TPR) repeat protein
MSYRQITRCRLALAAALLPALVGTGALATQGTETSACHTLAGQVTRSLMERPIPLLEGTGRLHQKVTTVSQEAQAYYDQGFSLLSSFVWVEAARSFNEALRRDPELAMAHLGLARAFNEVYANEDARAHLGKAREIAAKGKLTPKEAKWIELGILRLEAITAPREERAEKHRLYRQGIDELIALDLDDPHAWVLRGNAEESRPSGRGQAGGVGSVAYYEAALKRDPKNLAAHHYLVHSFENLMQPDRAYRHCQDYLAAAPAVPHAHHMCGHILPRLGKWGEALSTFETAYRLHRKSQQAEGTDPSEDWHWGHNLLLLGTTHLRLGQGREAEGAFREACRIAPRGLFGGSTCSAWLEYLVYAGRQEDALRAADEVQKLPSTLAHVIAESLRGEALLALGRLDEARQALERTRALKDKITHEAKGTAGEDTVPGYVEYFYIQILDAELALLGKDARAAEETLLQVASDVVDSPVIDSWANGMFQLERIAGHAERAGRPALAKAVRERIHEIDPQFPVKTPGRASR